MTADSGREVAAAINCGLMSHACKFRSNLLVVRLDPAILCNQTTSSDERDAQTGWWWCWCFCLDRGSHLLPRALKPGVHFEEGVQVSVRIVRRVQPATALDTHLRREPGTAEQERERLDEMCE